MQQVFLSLRLHEKCKKKFLQDDSKRPYWDLFSQHWAVLLLNRCGTPPPPWYVGVCLCVNCTAASRASVPHRQKQNRRRNWGQRVHHEQINPAFLSRPCAVGGPSSGQWATHLCTTPTSLNHEPALLLSGSKNPPPIAFWGIAQAPALKLVKQSPCDYIFLISQNPHV